MIEKANVCVYSVVLGEAESQMSDAEAEPNSDSHADIQLS